MTTLPSSLNLPPAELRRLHDQAYLEDWIRQQEIDNAPERLAELRRRRWRERPSPFKWSDEVL